jgi:hypothetical protein
LKEALAKPALVLAVDPGLSGATALVGYGDMTLKRDFKSHRDIALAISELIKHNNPQHLVVELVGARPGQGVCSMFSFGESTGVALGAIHAAAPGRPIERVAPLKWKNWYRKLLGIRKGCEVDSRQIANDLFPQFACYFNRKKDHNSADAFLMALWKLNHL